MIIKVKFTRPARKELSPPDKTIVTRIFPRIEAVVLRQTLLRPAVWQTGFLAGMDGLTNLTDYIFHIYLARALLPADFAVVQTVNTAVLILVTALAVLQPVVARYTAVSAAAHPPHTDRAIFQFYFPRSAVVGAGLVVGVWLIRPYLATWLGVPATAVLITAPTLLLIAVRPVVAGLLQGRRQFVSFGLTRLANAAGRLLLAVLFLGLWGGGAAAALAAIPLGSLIALLVGLAAVGWRIWQTAPPLPAAFRRPGRLTLAAFLALTAYMSLLSLDLIWVNRAFDAETAGAYATAVLLRRALLLLPAAVIVVMYPRAVARVSQGQIPDKLLRQTAVVVLLPTLGLTAAYALFGPLLIRWTFGAAYEAAAPLLLPLGLGMAGFGLTAVWLNFYLATHPWPFTSLLLVTAVAQLLLYDTAVSLSRIVVIFALSGWVNAVGGLVIYYTWLRPKITKKRQLL